MSSYTPLPVSKWSRSSLIKFMDRAWSDYLKAMLNSTQFSKDEKNKRIDKELVTTKMIHDLILQNELTWKKVSK